MDKTLQNALGHAEAGMAKAAEIRKAQQIQLQEVDRRIPEAVQALVENNRISATDAEKTASYLRDPVAALEFITRLAGHQSPNKKSVYNMGHTIQEKSAGIRNSEDDPWLRGLGVR